MPFSDSMLFLVMACVGFLCGVVCAISFRRSRYPFILTVAVGLLASNLLGCVLGTASMVAYYHSEVGYPLLRALAESRPSLLTFFALAMFLSGPAALLSGCGLQAILRWQMRRRS